MASSSISERLPGGEAAGNMADAPPPRRMSRRDMLLRAGHGMLGGACLLATGGSARLLFPRVHHTPPTTVAVGLPDDFAVGEVNERFKDTHRLVVVREEGGFYALRAVCTHLGCIPNWLPDQRKFRCPCHGSGFHADGKNFEGPAPRPMERLKISLDEDGQIVVDTGVRFFSERNEWGRPGAYLEYRSEEADV